ncbi:MAG TPA: M14 family zinc carboxypeptidase [Bacteroidia bacterium]|nr:M14 family zinc carboxypeptidase [Bacteroidia bacterium]
MTFTRLFLVASFFIPACGFAQKRKVFTTTPVYDSVIAAYTSLAQKYPAMTQLKTYGTTDVGRPLHLFVISKDGKFTPADHATKTVILINNGIHPGEPDGIDACIQLSQDLLSQPALLPDNVEICIIPVYNIGGCLNRGACSRVNQNGPAEYGFRGNAKNLDLNRDFIKCDAQNTWAFETIFQEWQPDIFVDTHVSDGADYQYVMTLIPTQRNKLHPVMADYMENMILPDLYKRMKEKKYEMCPYVETHGETPDSGIDAFLETPRYSTGYTALFNCIGFVTETHMLKPYNDRVWATYEFLRAIIDIGSRNCETMGNARRTADRMVANEKIFALNWKLDTASYDWFEFKGYEAKHKPSEFSGTRLYYDEKSPYTKKIKYYNTYTAIDCVAVPRYYFVPQAYTAVIDRMKLNRVAMKKLAKDTAIWCGMYYVTDYKSPKGPYESHFLHSAVSVSRDSQLVMFYKGDYIIETNQPCNRYIVETLEPKAADSFFAWNFFDGILQQKEWFSDYVFEDKADSILKHDATVKKQFDDKMNTDTAFAHDHWGQLNFIYHHSAYMERTYDRYPVGRLNGEMKLPED